MGARTPWHVLLSGMTQRRRLEHAQWQRSKFGAFTLIGCARLQNKFVSDIVLFVEASLRVARV